MLSPVPSFSSRSILPPSNGFLGLHKNRHRWQQQPSVQFSPLPSGCAAFNRSSLVLRQAHGVYSLEGGDLHLCLSFISLFFLSTVRRRGSPSFYCPETYDRDGAVWCSRRAIRGLLPRLGNRWMGIAYDLSLDVVVLGLPCAAESAWLALGQLI